VIPIQFKIAALLVLLAVAAYGGWKFNDNHWRAEFAKAEKKADADRQRLAAENAALIEEHARKEAKIEYRTKIIYRDVSRIAGPALCIDDERVRFRERWNEAARPASEPAD